MIYLQRNIDDILETACRRVTGLLGCHLQREPRCCIPARSYKQISWRLEWKMWSLRDHCGQHQRQATWCWWLFHCYDAP